MKEWKMLAVGNSFTQDSLYYLHDLAKAGDIELKAVNLYIGGCSLERHWNNVESDAKEYMYEENGESTERYVSINEMLVEDDWDYIITQQASHDSGIKETYFPYLEQLVEHFKSNVPNAECLLQKTWAYEQDSNHEEFPRYHCNQQQMYNQLSECYEEAAKRMGLRLIPSGDVIQSVRKKKPFRYELGEKSLCRDGFHMDMIYGRYLLSAVIYSFLFEKDIRENTFFPECAEREGIEVIKQCVYKMLNP
ncbi:DUF4886 domain-containing protein [Anaerosporobacter sp.]|uniref:DUF4886 domain-containing protein n=1 Tax=Anaerosporobacter sp. TaxID=1872529 RepID=UPI00286F6083|nr:DUF4886 domain-containing protein [Anaerosporobacter sp.]